MPRPLLFVLLLAACQPSVAPDGARDELLAADRAFAQATAERGVDGWVAYFAPDGRMHGGAQVISGRDSIRIVMTPVFADTTLSFTWEPGFAGVSDDGTLGYTVGRWNRRWVTSDAPLEQRGWYLTVWRRQADGSWKVEMDIGNTED